MPLSLLGLAVGLGALTAPPAPQPPRPAAPPSILVSTAWLAEHLRDPDVVIVHVAEGGDRYDEEHIPGARRLRYGDIATEVNGIPVELPPVPRLRAAFEGVGVGDGVTVVVVGNPMASARAWATLDFLGYGERAAVLDGGFKVWKDEGRAMTREAPAERRGTMSRATRIERVVDAEYVRARLGNARVALVDARPRNEYTGADGGHGGRHLAGHIPGARNLYWQELMVSSERPVFRDTVELRRRFEQAGAAADREVIAYCFIGMRASVTYFVARLLGYDARFYDGSWADWSAKHMPVEAGEGPAALPATPEAQLPRRARQP